MRILLFLCLIPPLMAQVRQKLPDLTREYKPLGILAKSAELQIDGSVSFGSRRMHYIRNHYRYQIKDHQGSILKELNFSTNSRPQTKFSINQRGNVAGCFSGKTLILRPPHYDEFEVEVLRHGDNKYRSFYISDLHWQPESLVCFGNFKPGDSWNGSKGFPFISTVQIDSKGIRNHQLIWTTWHKNAELNRIPDAYQHIAHHQLRGSFHTEGDSLFWIRSGLSPRFGNELGDIVCCWMMTNLTTGKTEALLASKAIATPMIKTLTELQITRLKEQIESSQDSTTTKVLKAQILSLQKTLKL